VEPLYFGNLFKGAGYLRKALFFGYPGEISVEPGPLELLPVCGRFQVGLGISDDSRRIAREHLHIPSLEVVEEDLGMFLFILGSLREDVGDLLEPFLAGGAGKVGVPVSGLRLAGECFQQVLLCLGASDWFAHWYLLLLVHSFGN
jgi:hypothetical protein